VHHPSKDKQLKGAVIMTAIIPHTPFTSIRALIGGEEVDAVDARSLHTWLQSGYQFADWFRMRTIEALLIEGVDFDSFSEKTEKPQIGRPAKDYALTVDAAMHVAMLERTEIGRMVRQDAIEWKKRAKAIHRGSAIAVDDPRALALACLKLCDERDAERDRRLLSDARAEHMQDKAAEEYSKRIGAEARVVRFEGRVTDITFEECYAQMYNSGHFYGLCAFYRDVTRNVTSFAKHYRREAFTNGGDKIDGHERFNWRGCTFEVPQTKDEVERGHSKLFKLNEKGVKKIERELNASRKQQLSYPGNDLLRIVS
jgi:phage anti-repressor protein